MRYRQIAKKPAKKSEKQIVERQTLLANIPVMKGPIYGIPSEEMEAWEDSLDTNSPMPEPQERRLE